MGPDMQRLWQQQLDKNAQAFADWWRAQAAFWQTVSDIQGQRGATLAQWWQNLPQQLQGLGRAQSWPEAVAALTRWQQQTWMSSFHLNSDTTQQRAYLWDEWLKLAQRNGWKIPGMAAPNTDTTPPEGKSSFYAAKPHLKPQAPAAKPAPAPAPAPTPAAPRVAEPAPRAEASPRAEPAPRPAAPPTAAPAAAAPAAYVPPPPGIFIPGPGHAAPAAAEETPPAASANGHTPEPARNAAQAATLAGASSARRSVVASHRGRAGRNRPH